LLVTRLPFEPFQSPGFPKVLGLVWSLPEQPRRGATT
jgi:hypothetical protein